MSTYEASAATTRGGSRVCLLLAVAVLAVDAAFNVVLAFQPYNTTVPSKQRFYDAMGSMPDVVNFFLGALVCAALLLVPRTREFALGFGLGFSAIWFAGSFTTLRWPPSEHVADATVQWCVMGARALSLPAALCLLAFGLRRGDAVPRLRPWGRPRVPLLILGLVPLALWTAAEFVETVRATPPQQDTTVSPVSCCTFGQLSVGAKTNAVAALIVGVALIALAASVTSRAVSSGVFAGLFVAQVGVAALYATMIEFPIEFHIGIQNRAVPAGTVLRAAQYPGYAALAGFWLLLAGLVLFALLAIIRPLVDRTGRDNSGSPAYHEPDTGLQRTE